MNPLLPATSARDGLNTGAAPVTYGQGERPPRGDYGRARADYTCSQEWKRYSAAEHALYARLYARQFSQLKDCACDEFVTSLAALDAAQKIPQLDAVSEKLYRRTRWQLVAVPGLIPEEAFFALLARRQFPVTEWLRRPEEFDYVVEPDIFHDFFGHVPLLFNPVFADYMQAYGEGGLKATSLTACEYLARLYWYTVEFGLIQTERGLRIYGAGILSSGTETRHSLTSSAANRVAFSLERIMRSEYRIDAFQETYFVIESFEQLFRATAPDFTPIYERLKDQGTLSPSLVLPGERTFVPNPSA
ncbi:MAG: phenylalanine 4-monooxygenase [Burkholderiaceae bacterium]|jgi:phenylalanine-4-hydroxylase